MNNMPNKSVYYVDWDDMLKDRKIEMEAMRLAGLLANAAPAAAIDNSPLFFRGLPRHSIPHLLDDGERIKLADLTVQPPIFVRKRVFLLCKLVPQSLNLCFGGAAFVQVPCGHDGKAE